MSDLAIYATVVTAVFALSLLLLTLASARNAELLHEVRMLRAEARERHAETVEYAKRLRVVR